MRKAFTLVELLVVVVVIAILASVAFRLGGLGDSSVARNTTVSRMQRLENCISGYFAAYGSYPPVSLQGRSRDIYCEVNGSGIQQVTHSPDKSVKFSTDKGWRQVEAACRAQPVGMRFPFKKGMQEYVRKVSDMLVEQGNNAMVFDALENVDRLGETKKKQPEWSHTQLFQFGLMSFLLPRYRVMMGYGVSESGDGVTEQDAAESLYNDFLQWGDNNSIPCRFDTGQPYAKWSDVNVTLGKKDEKWMIAAMPSQAVTARWMPNLAGILRCKVPIDALYGVSVCDGHYVSVQEPPSEGEIFSSGDSQSGEGGGKSQPYLLDGVTCLDGWWREFYYYSPPPYQSYRLWSAGENGKTFPPWIPDEEIERLSEKDVVRNWLSDDIVHMSN